MTTTNSRGVVGRGLGTRALPELPQTPAGSLRRVCEGRTTGVESGGLLCRKRYQRVGEVEVVRGMAGMSPEVGRVGPGTGEPSRVHKTPEVFTGATGDVSSRGWSPHDRESQAVTTVVGAPSEMHRRGPSTGELLRARQAQAALCRARNRGRVALIWLGCQSQKALFARLVHWVIQTSYRRTESTGAIGESTPSLRTCSGEFSEIQVVEDRASNMCSSICQRQIRAIPERSDHLLLDPDAGPQQFGAFIEISSCQGTQGMCWAITEQESTPGSHRARLEILEGGQREILTAIAEIRTTLTQLSTENQRRGKSKQSSISKKNSHGDSDQEKSRDGEEPHGHGRRRGGRVERGGFAVEKWLNETDHSRASSQRRGHHEWDYQEEDSDGFEEEQTAYWRRPHRREHHGGPRRGQGRHWPRDGDDERGGRYQDQRLRKPKIDFPRFSGGDPHEWLDKAKHYFHVYEVPREERVEVACFFLDGRASKWWRWLKFRFEQEGRRLGWTAFEQEFIEQWGPSPVVNHHGQLAKLKQEGKVQDYIEEFRRLQTLVRGWSEEALMGTFLDGLKAWLSREIKLRQPRRLQEAMKIAEILEESYHTDRRQNKEVTGGKGGKTPWKGKDVEGDTSKGKKEVKKLSKEEVQERISKGLCFKCGEKWSKEHRCKTGQVFQIVETSEEESEGDVQEEFGNEEDLNGSLESDVAELSLHAMSGARIPSTMRLMAWVGKHEVTLLVDSGSSHNFINANITKKVGLRGVAVEPFEVKVANGEKLKCEEVVRDVKLNVQGVRICADLHVITIVGLDVVLGNAWLRSIGRVLNDYEAMTMEFKLGGKKRLWKAISSKEIQPCEANVMERLWKGGACCFAVVIAGVNQEKVEEKQGEEELEKKLQQLPPSIRCVVEKHRHVLEVPNGLPPPRAFDHRIVLHDETRPVNVAPYRYAHFQKGEIERQVEEMLSQGLIRTSTSPFSSPVLLVRKKDGSWRFCTDYRALNEATIKDRFPIPTVDEMLDELHGAMVFTKLDLRAGYHQIRMREEDVYKTAFRTHSGHYEYLIMPFGLCNAPSTFQAAMNEVFKPFLRKFVLVFFDDILVYSTSLEEHIGQLQVVLGLLEQHHFFIKLSKCEFVQRELEYLGHIISGEGVKVDPKKIEAMVDWPLPANITALRGFLGLTGYYRRFVKGYGLIAKPLTSMLGKKKLEWNDGAKGAFEELKRAMTHTPVLALPNFEKPFEVYTDASGEGIGAVLVQEKRPLAFISKALGPMKRAWSTYGREMLAVIHAVKIWRPYLLGRKFTIVTDQQPLRHLLEQKIVTPEQQKFMVKLLGFEYDIVYQPGKENKVADALSRKEGSPMLWTVYGELEASLQALSGAEWEVWDKIRGAIQLDKRALEICAKLEKQEEGVEGYRMRGGLIYYKDGVYVPGVPMLREEILSHFHDSKEGGHSGWLRTYIKVKHFFHWEGLKNEVKEWVARCDICQKVKYDQRAPMGLLQPLPTPAKIWEDLSMDFVEGLPTSRGCDAILVVVDRLSKGAHFIPLRHPFTASSVAKIFVEHVVRLHGIPRSILTDRGALFMSSFWQELFSLQGSKLRASSSYHPQTDGQTEVVNRTLEQYLRCYCHDEQTRWREYLPWAEYWYNTSYHASIDTSPFEVIYGRSPPRLNSYEKGTAKNDEVEKELLARDEILSNAKKALSKAQERMKRHYDQGRRNVSFEPGDFVYLKLQPYRQKSLKKRFNVKLSQRYYGPFKVLERVGEVAYKLELPTSSLLHPVFHVTALKKKVGEPEQVVEELPNFDEEGNMMMKPSKALRYRQEKKNKNGKRAWQVLVQWQGLPVEEATWEDYEEVKTMFPNLSLEDKGILEGEGNGEVPVRRSARIRDQANNTAMEELEGSVKDHHDEVGGLG